MQGMEQPDGERAAAPQPAAARRNVGYAGDLDAAAGAQQLHRFAHQWVPDAIHAARFFGLGVGDADALVELLVDRDVNELVDGRGDNRAAELAIERRQVRAAANEAHAQWGPGNNHRVRERRCWAIQYSRND